MRQLPPSLIKPRAAAFAAIAAATLGALFTATPSRGQAATEHKLSYHDYRRGLFALSKVQSAAIVMLGDSLTEGAPWRELTGCPDLVNRGIGGDTTRGVLERLDEVAKLQPRAVFLMIGVNDITRGVPPASTLDSLRGILARLEALKIHTFLAYVLPVTASYPKKHFNDQITALNVKIADVMAEHPAVSVIDLRPLLSGPDGYLREELSFDGLHLSPKGYAVWRDAIAHDVAQLCPS
jgi:lysophospholipase L1-like esterase